jgi:PAS domain S-box-containing protein
LPRSFWAQLAIVLVTFSIVASATLGLLSYNAARGVIRNEAIRSVGLLATMREEALERLLAGRRARALTFLRAASLMCSTHPAPARQPCFQESLQQFVTTEGAEGARLVLASGAVLTAGTPVDLQPRVDAEAAFSLDHGHPIYAFEVGVNGRRLLLRVPITDVEVVFAGRTGLGTTGDTYLVDDQGAFLTLPRRPITGTHADTPIVRACLAGQTGEALGRDERGVAAIYGFRPVRELGAGCVIADVDQMEAFAPLEALKRRAILLGVVFTCLCVPLALLLASRISRPLERLTAEARALRAGRYDTDVKVPARAPAELRTFAATFADLARSIRSSRAALLANQQRTRAVLDHALDAVIGMDAEGRICDFNPRAESMFGWTREEVMGRSLAETIIPKRLRAAHTSGLHRFLETGEGPVLGRRVELPALRRDGVEFPVQLAIAVIREGDEVSFSAFVSDVTAEREAEAEAEHQRTRVRTMFLNAPSLMALTSGPDHVIELANPPVIDFFGGHAVVGRRLTDLLRDATGSDDVSNLDLVYHTGEPYSAHEARVRLVANGRFEARWLDVICQPVHAPDGTIEGLMLHAVDVTEQVRARRRIEDAVRVRDDFLSIASHELKTPLTSLGLQMQSVARVARSHGVERVSAERLDHMLEVSNRQIRRLAQLVDDLLDVGRVSEGRMLLEREDVELGSLVRDVVARLAEDAARAGCTVQTEMPPTEVHGRWDRLRLEQVLSNLLTNAFKYAPRQPVTVRVDTRPHAARLVVVDRGIGIAAEAQRLIFERWGRAVSPRNFGGLGLGLYIVQQILAAHGGRIAVESQPGQGATFICELPRD